MTQPNASRNWRVAVVVAIMLAIGAVALRQVSNRTASPSGQSSAQQLSALLTPVDTGAATEKPQRSGGSAPLHPVHINMPDGPPALATDQRDMHGNAVTINCSTCHSIKQPNFDNRATADLDEFHQGLTVNHGSLTCLSCHNPDDYDTLRLADGSSLPYRQVMTLCGQCHGPQLRDYNHGVHGGMTGYWDRSKGPRYRNNCIDCHDPHAPAFPKMMPTFKPIDRFLKPTEVH